MKNIKFTFTAMIILLIFVSIKIGIDIYIHNFITNTELQPYHLKSSNELKIDKKFIEKKLFFNPFLYKYLLKAGNINYALLLKGENDYLNDTVKNLKLSIIFNQSDMDISINGVKKLLYLWNKLSAKDKSFCSSVFMNILKTLEEKELDSILDIWQKRSMEISFFEKALFNRPVFFKKIADRLIHFKKYLKERWVFLSNHEIYYLLEKRKLFYNSLSELSKSIQQQQNFLQDIIANIKGYYKLSKNNNFNETVYLKFLSEIYLTIIDSYVSKIDAKNSDEVSFKLIETIEEYLKYRKFPNNITNLMQVFEKYDLFRYKGQKILYIKNLISFESREFSKVINKINQFFQSNDKIDINLNEKFIFLLIDSCISNNLFFKAEAIINKYESIINNKDKLLQRIYIINSSLNRDLKVTVPDNTDLDKLKRHGYIEFKGDSIEKKIYLTGKKRVFIKISDEAKHKNKDQKLLQIFINNRIIDEIYIDDINNFIDYQMPKSKSGKLDCWKVKLRLADKRRI